MSKLVPDTPSEMSQIVRTADTCFGRPRLAGSRLTVIDVVEGIYNEGHNGYRIYAADFDLSDDDINACLKYCANLDCQKTAEYNSRFCNRCVLDTDKHTEYYGEAEEINLPDGGAIVQITPGAVFLGSLSELWESEAKVKGWLIAQEIILDNLDAFNK
jgi:uncharacterized protein (DUF433 family)